MVKNRDLFAQVIANSASRTAPYGHMAAYITPTEASILRSTGGGVSPNGGQIMRNGIPSFQYNWSPRAGGEQIVGEMIGGTDELLRLTDDWERTNRAGNQNFEEAISENVTTNGGIPHGGRTEAELEHEALEAEEFNRRYQPVAIEGGRAPSTLSLGNVVHSATRDPVFTDFEEYNYPTLDKGLGSMAARGVAAGLMPFGNFIPGFSQGIRNIGTSWFTEEGRQHQANRSIAADSAREIMAWAGNDPAKMALANAEFEKLSLQYPGLMPGENQSYSHSQLSALSGMRPHEQIIATGGDQVDPDGNVYSGGQSPWDIANENEHIMMAEILAGQQRDQAPPRDGDVDGSVSDEEQLRIDRVLENIAQLPEGYADRLGLVNHPTIPIQPQPPYSGDPRISPETPAPIPAPAGFQKPATYINPGDYPDIFVNDMTGERFKAPSLGYVPPPGWRRVSESSQNLRPPNRLQPDKFGRTLLW